MPSDSEMDVEFLPAWISIINGSLYFYPLYYIRDCFDKRRWIIMKIETSNWCFWITTKPSCSLLHCTYENGIHWLIDRAQTSDHYCMAMTVFTKTPLTDSLLVKFLSNAFMHKPLLNIFQKWNVKRNDLGPAKDSGEPWFTTVIWFYDIYRWFIFSETRNRGFTLANIYAAKKQQAEA